MGISITNLNAKVFANAIGNDACQSIPRTFDELEKALGGEADKVTVTYDEIYGYPAQVGIDFIEQAVDDELGLTITNFEVLP